jgi:ribonuclease HI
MTEPLKKSAAEDSKAAAKHKPAVAVYTDGGCDPNPGTGGWAAILRDMSTGKEKELSGAEPNTTNNRMEMTALLRALQTLKCSCRVSVTTDSQYLANAFTQGWLASWKRKGWKTATKEPVKNRDLWEALSAETERHEITWNWVRGHAGHPENERCDEMVGEARRRLRRK